MVTVLDSLNAGLRKALSADERVYLLGEDLLDPYGGAFKMTRGLSSAFPGRVITTPVSEAGIAGVAAGMALRGLRPVVEIMFGDFITLVADQLVNHISKFRWMYSGGKPEPEAVQVPLVIRTPMGGRRGYGPTHSQTLEKLFLGVPGLTVLAPSAVGDPGELLFQAVTQAAAPVLFVENKLLYLLPLQDEHASDEFLFTKATPGATYPTYQATIRGAPPPVLTLAAYGYAAELARQAALKLAYEHELFVECIVPTQLAPFELSAVIDSARRTGCLLVFEEGTRALGWGAEVLAQVMETVGGDPVKARRLGAKDSPLAASRPLEDAALPGVEEIIQAARAMLG